MSEAKSVGSYDYVIVGAGSAGCVLANRLTQDPAVNVLLLEAGGEDKYWWIHVPVGMPYLLGNKEVDWCFQSEPEPYCDNRITPVPRGKTLGGSSSINAMLHPRPRPRLRYLAAARKRRLVVGRRAPVFQEHREISARSQQSHGVDGELSVQDNRQRWEIVEAWKRAAIEYGIPETDDHNAGDTEGITYFQGTIRNGRRWSAAQAFLRPAMDRSNLRVLTNAHAKVLRFDGKRAVGVEFWQGDELKYAQAKGEVILAAGAIVPQLLQLSGVGPAALLGQHGIAVRHEPRALANMRTIGRFSATYKVKNTITMNQWVQNPLRRYGMGAYYLLTKRGPMGTQPPQLCAFTRSDLSQDTPNLQYHVSAASSERFGGPLHDWPGFSNGIAVVRPQSIGYCRIKSPDPRAHPAILHNFLHAGIATGGRRRYSPDAAHCLRPRAQTLRARRASARA
jgi:choline dehydrogenase